MLRANALKCHDGMLHQVTEIIPFFLFDQCQINIQLMWRSSLGSKPSWNVATRPKNQQSDTTSYSGQHSVFFFFFFENVVFLRKILTNSFQWKECFIRQCLREGRNESDTLFSVFLFAIQQEEEKKRSYLIVGEYYVVAMENPKLSEGVHPST
jgi:hypothetical protein